MSSAERGTQSGQRARSTGNHRRSRPGLLPWVAIATLATGLFVGANLSADTRSALLGLAGLDADSAPRAPTVAPGSQTGSATASAFVPTGTVAQGAHSSLERPSARHPAASGNFAPSPATSPAPALAVGPGQPGIVASARPLVLPPSSSSELRAALQDLAKASGSTGLHSEALPPVAPALQDSSAGSDANGSAFPLPGQGNDADAKTVGAGETDTAGPLPDGTEMAAFRPDPSPPETRLPEEQDLSGGRTRSTGAQTQVPAHARAPAAPALARAGEPLDALFQTLAAAPTTDADALLDGLPESGSEIADARFAGAPDSWRGGVTGAGNGTGTAAPAPPTLSHRDTPDHSGLARTAALGPGHGPAAGSLAPWRRHAAPAPAGNGPAVAVIIDDMGLDRPRTRRIAALEGPLTLSYLTYAGNLREQMRAARGNGHELLLHMPMEPLDPKADPGPGALRLADSPERIARTLRDNLDRGEGYVGINNHMGSRFTADAGAMTLVMEELSRRGLMWVDSVTSARTKGAVTAAAMGVPWASRTVFLDNDADSASVLKQLAELERAARRHGHAIAIGHPREGTIIALQAWLPTLQDKGIRLVPVSALARTPAKAPGTLVSHHGTDTQKERTP